MRTVKAIEHRDGLGRSFWQPELDGKRAYVFYSHYDTEYLWTSESILSGDVKKRLFRSRRRALRVARRRLKEILKNRIEEVKEE